jgi:hypothetical protein
MGLIIAGPLRAAWRRPEADAQGWRRQFPMLLSLTLVLSLFTFFTQIAHPVANFWGRGRGPDRLTPAGVHQELGIVSILLTTAVVMGVLLPTVARRALPVGSLTLILTLNAAAMGLLYYGHPFPLAHVVMLAAAGVVADLLLWLLRPSAQRPLALRLFAFAVPAVFYLVYFLGLMLTDGVWWSVHLWSGAIVLAGIVGWLLSYLPVPPRAAGAR